MCEKVRKEGGKVDFSKGSVKVRISKDKSNFKGRKEVIKSGRKRCSENNNKIKAHYV